jgi:hypothetical protein
MRNVFLMLLLISTIKSFSQKTIDTTEIYNGELTRKRIELSSTGEIAKEIYYQTDSAKTEYFLQNGRRIRWIAYDENGNIISEWSDPKIETAKNRRIRNVTFALSLLAIGAFVIIGCKLNYRKTFNALLLISAIYPFIILFVERLIAEEDKNKYFTSTIGATLFIIPATLGVLSVTNLIKRIRIPLGLTILGILLSAGFLIFFYMIMKAGQIRMLG